MFGVVLHNALRRAAPLSDVAGMWLQMPVGDREVEQAYKDEDKRCQDPGEISGLDKGKLAAQFCAAGSFMCVYSLLVLYFWVDFFLAHEILCSNRFLLSSLFWMPLSVKQKQKDMP